MRVGVEVGGIVALIVGVGVGIFPVGEEDGVGVDEGVGVGIGLEKY